MRDGTSKCQWLRRIGATLVLSLGLPGHALAVFDATREAPTGAPAARESAADRAAAIGLLGKRASARGVLARLRSRDALGPAPAAVAATLARADLELERDFDVVPGLKRLVRARRARAGRASARLFERQELLATIERLKESGLFEYVEPDWQVHVLTPTDSSFVNGDLWALRNTGQRGGIAGIDVNAVDAWSVSSGSPGVVVGVVDTGIRYTHRDLAANMWVNPREVPGNGLDDDANGYVDDVHGIDAITGSGNPFDDNGHGTHVGGTIAATAFDAGPHVGVAYDVRLMALKFLGESGIGTVSGAIACIEYAVEHGVDILSNSWGGGGFSEALRDAIQAAADANVLFVAAAGNDGSNTDLVPHYPSGYDVPSVVSVAAIDRRGDLAHFSNHGTVTVDLAAPGVDILSTTAASDLAYGTASGTSMATPHVAGVAALIASLHPGIGLVETKERLMAGATPLDSLTGRVATGAMVDAHASLTIAADGALDLSATPDGPLYEGRAVAMHLTVADLAPVTGATVTGGFHGAEAQPFLDDGNGPDRVAGDGVYSADLAVPAGVSRVSLDVWASAPGRSPAVTSFAFAVVSPPPNDDFTDRIVLEGGTTSTRGTNQHASTEPGEPRYPWVAGGKTVWWEWTAPVPAPAADVTISTAGSSYDTTLAIYTGTSLADLALVGSNDDASGLQSAVSFTAVPGAAYQIQVDGFAGASGDIRLSYPSPLADGPPVMVTQPVGRAVFVDDAFSVAIGAVGLEPMRFQWFHDGAPIEGADGDTYSVRRAAESDEGRYTVRVSNERGVALSDAAYVFVDPAGSGPGNDDFADRLPLAGPTVASATNVGATGEFNEPVHASVSNPLASVWWSWQSPGPGEVTFSTAGSDYDTTIAAYTGDSLGSLVEIAANDDAVGLQSRVSFRAAAGVRYAVAVDGYGASVGSIRLTALFAPDPPPDSDGDGVPDDTDNCPFDANPDQTDTDGDSLGSPCDGDDDGDGVDDGVDRCPVDATNACDTGEVLDLFVEIIRAICASEPGTCAEGRADPGP